MKPPPGFVAVRAVGARGFARSAAAPWVEATLGRWGTLSRAALHEPDTLEFRGRGVVRAIPAPVGPDGTRWAVRRYHRGGWMAPLLGDRYLRRGTPRPVLEARASDAARARGIPTPEVQAGLIHPTGTLWYRAEIVTTFVSDSVDLAGFLFHGRTPSPEVAATPAARTAALAGAGRLAGRLAEAGVFHPDLNARNFLVVDRDDAVEVQVLDLDRARAVARPVPLAPMAARLTRSLRKFETLTGVALGEEAWSAFRDAIGGAP